VLLDYGDIFLPRGLIFAADRIVIHGRNGRLFGTLEAKSFGSVGNYSDAVEVGHRGARCVDKGLEI
jgi:hypothetical protein